MSAPPCCNTQRAPTFLRSLHIGHVYECATCGTPLLHHHGLLSILRPRPGSVRA